jgi:hypothetical protein
MLDPESARRPRRQFKNRRTHPSGVIGTAQTHSGTETTLRIQKKGV